MSEFNKLKSHRYLPNESITISIFVSCSKEDEEQL